MSYNKTKTDPELGQQVHEHLSQLGLETPVTSNLYTLSRTDKIEAIESRMREVLEIVGMDLSDDSLLDTPKRVAKMYVNEIFWGLHPDTFPKCTAVANKIDYDEMVVERNIQVSSFCEHHLVAIDGKAHVGYIPKHKVLGLSKLNRIVEYFSKRPQIQERLTEQIYHALSYILGTEEVAVIIDAAHFCVKHRGVEDTGSFTITSKLGGRYKTDTAHRAEFMQLVHRV